MVCELGARAGAAKRRGNGARAPVQRAAAHSPLRALAKVQHALTHRYEDCFPTSGHLLDCGLTSQALTGFSSSSDGRLPRKNHFSGGSGRAAQSVSERDQNRRELQRKERADVVRGGEKRLATCDAHNALCWLQKEHLAAIQ